MRTADRWAVRLAGCDANSPSTTPATGADTARARPGASTITPGTSMTVGYLRVALSLAAKVQHRLTASSLNFTLKISTGPETFGVFCANANRNPWQKAVPLRPRRTRPPRAAGEPRAEKERYACHKYHSQDRATNLGV